MENPSVELVAIVEPSPRGRERATAIAPGVAVFDSLDAMLESTSVGVIDVATPPRTHVDVVSAAVAAGAHVFCEKPFLLNGTELGRVREAVARSPVVVEPCHNWLHAPAIERALEVVTSGCLGPPYLVRFTAFRTRHATGADHWEPNWRVTDSASGGILGDLGYHGMYLGMRAFGTRPESVAVSDVIYVPGNPPVPVAATCHLEFGSRGVCELHLNWQAPTRTTEFTVRCRDGWASVLDNRLTIESHRRASDTQVFSGLDDSWHADWINSALGQFLTAIQTPARHGSVPDDAAWSVIVLEATLASASSGKHVQVRWSSAPPNTRRFE